MLTVGCVNINEAIITHPPDPHTGSRLMQLTSTPAIHHNIYNEIPWTDSKSQYCLISRQHVPYGPVEIWRVAIATGMMTPICENVEMRGLAISPSQRDFYCIREIHDDLDHVELVQTDMTTLEQKSMKIERERGGIPGDGRVWSGTKVSLARPLAILTDGTVSPDHTAYYYGVTLGVRQFGIVRIDLGTGERTLIHQHPEISNPHPQIEPGRGEWIMVQHNQGRTLDDRNQFVSDLGWGNTLYLLHVETGECQPLPVGKPHTEYAPHGHECWVGHTGQIIFATQGLPSEEMAKVGNLMIVRPGDEKSRVLARGHHFIHLNTSRDGRFFVADTYPDSLIVVGSIATGRNAVLCKSGTSHSRPAQYTHPHPYFTPDSRWVIFNSDRTGIPHVWAAEVPDGFLEDLES